MPGAERCDIVPPVQSLFCSALAVDLPAKDPTASVGKEAEVGAPAPEQGPSPVEQPLRTVQPSTNTPSRSPTSASVSENDSPVGVSQPSAAGMQELVSASSALLSVTRDVSTTHTQVSLRLPTCIWQQYIPHVLIMPESTSSWRACNENRKAALVTTPLYRS